MRFFHPGQVVLHEDQLWNIVELDGPDTLILLNQKSNRFKVASTATVTRPERQSVGKRVSIHEAAPEALEMAQTLVGQLEIIDGLPRSQRKAAIDALAAKLDVSTITIYRRLGQYRKAPVVSAQLRKQRSDKGAPRRSSEQEALIQQLMKRHLSKRTGESVRELLTRVNKEFTARGWKKISYGLLLDRSRNRPLRDRMAKTLGGSALREAIRPKPGRFRLAEDGPLSFVQIDHTKIDVMLVDEESREVIGRAYLTLIIDGDSRVVLGFYISLDPVGMLSTGMALFHAIMPKDEWLRERNISGDVWPCSGLMRAIHTDNAKEFTGRSLGLFCREYDIELLQRRKGLPSDGGIVERGFGTFMRQVGHTTEGTTFSNVGSKFSYDSEGNALLSLTEFERLFTFYITHRYHQKPHSGIGGLPPILRWKDGLLGTELQPGVGAPEVPDDPRRLWVKLLPTFERVITSAGVEWQYRNYYCDAIQPRAHEHNPDEPSKKRIFTFHFDPRDVSRLWMEDPDTEEIIEIPCADPNRQAISIWQLRAAIKKVRDRGAASVNDQLIYDAIDEMDNILETASQKNKAARRERARKAEWEKAKKKSVPKVLPLNSSVLVDPADPPDEFGDLSDLTPTAEVKPWKR